MIESILQTFLSNHVTPDPDIVAQAQASQAWLREVLKTKMREQADLPGVLENADFLFGSAVRGTHTAPFDDIDLMLVLDGSALICMENGQRVGSAYGVQTGSNVLLQPQYLDLNGFVSSQKVLARVRRALGETYSRSDISKDGQAINVWLDSYGFGIDVVPALKVNTVPLGEHYYIPQGTGSDMWMSTQPLADLRAFEGNDRLMNGRLRSTARLMRQWNRHGNANRLSGFHIDALTLRVLTARQPDSLVAGMSMCLAAFTDLLATTCPQISGIGAHIDHKLTLDDRGASMRAIQDAQTCLIVARSASLLGNRAKTLESLNEIFGRTIPA